MKYKEQNRNNKTIGFIDMFKCVKNCRITVFHKNNTYLFLADDLINVNNSFKIIFINRIKTVTNAADSISN